MKRWVYLISKQNDCHFSISRVYYFWPVCHSDEERQIHLFQATIGVNSAVSAALNCSDAPLELAAVFGSLNLSMSSGMDVVPNLGQKEG